MTKNNYTCDKCHKSYNSAKSLASHTKWHNESFSKISLEGAARGRKSYKENNIGKNIKQRNIDIYNNNPKHCFHCKKILPYKSKRNKFCNSSCSASFNNKNIIFSKRGPSPKEKYLSSKIEPRICEYTGKIWWYNGRYRKLSPYRKSIKKQYYDRCAFKFNVYEYPDIFNLELIDQYGWYYCPNKKHKDKIKNVNGISRDHKVSIKEAFENSYNPYYISHLMNCELVKHSENKKKNSNSSITYEELIILVKEYDIKNLLF